jgi:hypothetical protein
MRRSITSSASLSSPAIFLGLATKGGRDSYRKASTAVG